MLSHEKSSLLKKCLFCSHILVQTEKRRIGLLNWDTERKAEKTYTSFGVT